MSDWLVIGSAPTVLDWLEPIYKQRHMRVITCNSGIKINPTPDVYMICDQKACAAYQDRA